MRGAWDYYPKSTDQAPHEFQWIMVALGNYSNLPSYLCTAMPGIAPAQGAKKFAFSSPPNTACLEVPVGATATTPPTSYNVYISRTLVPRIDIAGEISIPSYPFVFGYDANLGQYSKWLSADNVDFLNKPGNNVRLYFGVTFDVPTALSKLGLISK